MTTAQLGARSTRLSTSSDNSKSRLPSKKISRHGVCASVVPGGISWSGLIILKSNRTDRWKAYQRSRAGLANRRARLASPILIHSLLPGGTKGPSLTFGLERRPIPNPFRQQCCFPEQGPAKTLERLVGPVV